MQQSPVNLPRITKHDPTLTTEQHLQDYDCMVDDAISRATFRPSTMTLAWTLLAQSAEAVARENARQMGVAS